MRRPLILVLTVCLLAVATWAAFPRPWSPDRLARRFLKGTSQSEVALAMVGQGAIVVKGDDRASWLIVTRRHSLDSVLGAISFTSVTFEFRKQRLINAFAIEKDPLGDYTPRQLALQTSSH